MAVLEVETRGLVGAAGSRSGLAETAVLIQDHFNEEELAEVCFRLGIEPEQVKGDTMVTRPFELVRMCQRMGKMGELIGVLGEKRPFVDWE